MQGVVDGQQGKSAAPSLRPDIQGLRALAVLMVVVYHLVPRRLPGGFLGVDVFFVISGYLIMGSLARSTTRGTLSITTFYGKRIRRLLPAATLTLLGVSAMTMLTRDAAGWPDTMRQVLASALQVQNWQLASAAGDYVQATADASPLQHFWSLAVEEQFYILTPLLFLALTWFARRRGHSPSSRAVVVLIWVVTLASLAYSMVYTPMDHAAAYFVTPTRMWQLGFGGLLATLEARWPLPALARTVAGWAALAVVLVCALTYSTTMTYPGWVAIVPTLASAVLILVGRPDALARALDVSHWLGRQPWRYIGDISYSLYLVHWPLIVLALARSPEGRLGKKAMVLVLVAALGLAAVSKHVVEDPFRRLRMRKRTVFALGASMVAASCLVGSTGLAYGNAEFAAATRRVGLDPEHRGYLAVKDGLHPSRLDPGVQPMPRPEVALQDLSEGFRHKCDATSLGKHPATSGNCLFGAATAPNLMVLVGDSHAGQYSTILIDFVRKHPQWRLKIMNLNRCPFNAVAGTFAGKPNTECAAHTAALMPAIAELRPKVLVTAAMSPRSYLKDAQGTWPSYDAMVAGYRTQLQKVRAMGTQVIAIAELPRHRQPVPACVKAAGTNVARCDTPTREALQPRDRPLAQAARSVPGVRVIDPMPVVCGRELCPAIVGNVLVFRDNHLSNTYVRSIAAWFQRQLALD